MARELHLDGSEITILKALGVGSAEQSGEDLMKKIPNMDVATLSSTLRDLMLVGYINADKNSFYQDEEFKATNFQVNPGYAKDLRDALEPDEPKPRSRRVRRE